MILDTKPFSEITEQDLRLIIANGESEGKKQDFKEKLSVRSDEEKKKFCTDICAFANAGGGFIIYGMKEVDGMATDLPGISDVDIDQEILKLENTMRSGIVPRVPGVQSRPINLSNGTFALIIKIPMSWASPHMLEGASRFFSRSSNGNYPLDVHEIRSAFLASDMLSNSIKNFRMDRVGKIIAGETPVIMQDGAKIILHLIPLSTIKQQSTEVDINRVLDNPHALGVIFSDPLRHRINIDGIVTYSLLQDTNSDSYTQLFRNGSIESVNDSLLKYQKYKGRPAIPWFESQILDICRKLVKLQKELGVEPPIYIWLTLVGVKGYVMYVNSQDIWGYRHLIAERTPEIDRDTIMIPEVIIQNYESLNLDTLLKPAFDTVWNAAGWPKSLNYDENGKLKK